jgi:hypothetical protein
MANFDISRAATSCIWWSEALGMHQNKWRKWGEEGKLLEGVSEAVK